MPNASQKLPPLGLKGLFKSIGVLFSANMTVALLGLATLAITARALGPAGVGLLALIEAYARAVDQVFRFEPGQALVRYGTQAREAGDEERLRQLIKFSSLMDVAGAGLAALLAYLGLHVIGAWFGFTDNQMWLAGLYVLSIPFYVSATPIAILRLFERFNLYAKVLVGVAMLRLVVAFGLWQAGADFPVFLGFMIVSAILEHLIPLAMAWMVLRREVDGPVLSLPLRGVLERNPGLLRFIFNANANVVARNSTRQLDTIVLGGLVSQAEIGFYQIAKRIGLAALRLAKSVQFVIFPMLTRLWEQGRQRALVRLVLGLNGALAVAGACGIGVLFVIGEPAIDLTFGEEFRPAKVLLALHLFAAAILLGSTTLNAALLSIGADKALLYVTLVATAVFFVGLVPAVEAYGVAAASVLHIVFNVIWTVGCGWAFLAKAGGRRPSSAA